MADYSTIRSALLTYMRAGYTARTIYPDAPGEELTASDELSGWIEIEWRPGDEGSEGGRYGPTQTFYLTEFEFTPRIMIPRGIAGGLSAAWDAAWAAVVALRNLLLEAQVSDLYVHTVRPRPLDLEDTDSHVQIDLTCTGSLESTK